ncbi:hypothetical protein [Rhodoblastus sp.]
MKFQVTVIPSGNATAVEVPAEVMQALGPEAQKCDNAGSASWLRL